MKSYCKILVFGGLFISGLGTFSCENISEEPPTIAKTVVGNPFFTTLETAAIKSGLAIVLSNPNTSHESGAFTIFAPTDEAFAKLSLTDAQSLNALNPEFLSSTLLFHVSDGNITGDDLEIGSTIPSKIGVNKKLIFRGSDRYLNGSKVIFTDAASANGVFHGIDKVMLGTGLNMVESVIALTQNQVFAGPEMTFLLEAVLYAGLDVFLTASEGFTVLAPNDDAFRALNLEKPADIRLLSREMVSQIVKNHIVADGGKFTSEREANHVTTLNGGQIELGTFKDGYFSIKSAGNSAVASMVIPDIQTNNGVVHIIDRVLLP